MFIVDTTADVAAGRGPNPAEVSVLAKDPEWEKKHGVQNLAMEQIEGALPWILPTVRSPASLVPQRRAE